jgi:hypothetical protein
MRFSSLKVLDDLDLAALRPAGEHEEQELERRDRHSRRLKLTVS